MGVGAIPMPGPPPAAAPPGGWPGGLWGVVMSLDTAPFATTNEDYVFLLPYNGANLPSWASAQSFANLNGASARFGHHEGYASDYSKWNTGLIGQNQRYVGECAIKVGAGTSSFRIGVSGIASNNYTFVCAIGTWHTGSYTHSLVLWPDGNSGSEVPCYSGVTVSASSQRIDAVGAIHADDASWLAAEPTARVAFSATSFVEVRGNISGSNLTFAHMRIYEAP